MGHTDAMRMLAGVRVKRMQGGPPTSIWTYRTSST